jgi:hypothetical protein
MSPTYLDQLQSDQADIARILQAQRDVPTEDAHVSVQLLRNTYLVILEDALSVVNSLIQFLTTKEPSDRET